MKEGTLKAQFLDNPYTPHQQKVTRPSVSRQPLHFTSTKVTRPVHKVQTASVIDNIKRVDFKCVCVCGMCKIIIHMGRDFCKLLVPHLNSTVQSSQLVYENIYKHNKSMVLSQKYMVPIAAHKETLTQ